MGEDRPELGAGDVTINLDGEQVTLRATLSAALALAATPEDSLGLGGFAAVNRAMARLDPLAITRVIVLGMGYTGEGPKELNIPERIFRTGYSELQPVCIDYLTRLLHGGRPAAKRATQEGQDGAPLEPIR